MSNPVLFGVMVAAGSAFGGVCRWLIGLAFNPMWAAGFPLGTLLVNGIGGLLAGLAFVWFGRAPAEMAGLPSEAWRMLIVTGCLGGLTTFSTFSVEWFTLFDKGRYAMSMAHVLSHVVAALLCAALGAKLMRMMLG